jgi:hypothetical protein
MTVVLRIHGPELDVTRVRALIPAARVEHEWRRGEAGRLDRTMTTSGLSMLLSQEDTDGASMREATSALDELLPRIAEFLGDGVVAELDIALHVGPERPRSLVLDGALLQRALTYDLRVVATAYPTAEEAE